MCIYEFSELFLLNTWFLNLKRAYLFFIENGETADLQCSLPSPAARGARTQTATCRNWLFLTTQQLLEVQGGATVLLLRPDRHDDQDADSAKTLLASQVPP